MPAMIAKSDSPQPLKPLIERAFEMARSGSFTKVEYIERALYNEGYPKGSLHWNSPSLRKQLRATCQKATAAPVDGGNIAGAGV